MEAIVAVAAALFVLALAWYLFQSLRREKFTPVKNAIPDEYRFDTRTPTMPDVREIDPALDPPGLKAMEFTHPGSEAHEIAASALRKLNLKDPERTLQLISVEYAATARIAEGIVYDVTFMATDPRAATLGKFSLVAVENAAGGLRVARLRPFGADAPKDTLEPAGDFEANMARFEPDLGVDLDAMYGPDTA